MRVGAEIYCVVLLKNFVFVSEMFLCVAQFDVGVEFGTRVAADAERSPRVARLFQQRTLKRRRRHAFRFILFSATRWHIYRHGRICMNWLFVIIIINLTYVKR